MLDLVSSGLLSLWFNQPEVVSFNLPLNPAAVEESVLQLAPTGEASDASTVIQKYLQDMGDRGFDPQAQGIWLQTDSQILSSKDGFTPHSAASITKVATSLVSLKAWGPQHQFQTLISSTGLIQNGILKGDLVVQGDSDPLFVWETAIELGNALNAMGIGIVSGNLVIVGDFAMNFQRDPLQAGNLLKQALDASQWPPEATHYFQQMPYGTRAPKIKIIGTVQVADETSSQPNQRLLLRHNSLPLIQLLKQMNIYSNNDMAEMFGKEIGGGPEIAKRAAWYAGVPEEEIQLINGSGLGEENRISPRAAAALFRALQDELRHWQAPGTSTTTNRSYTIADVFPVVGVDQGTVKDRNIPATAVVKTGTLNYVSALGGVIPTRDEGLVWFTIMNRGDGIEEMRHQQDNFLQAIAQKWGLPLSPPLDVAPTSHNAAPKSGQDMADKS